MKRIAFVVVLVVALAAVVAGTALAAPAPQSGTPFGGMMGGGHMNSGGTLAPGYGMMGAMMGSGITMMGDDLEALGISHEEIHAAHVAGKSLVELAAEKGVGEEQLTQAILEGRRTALNQAVEQGRLTREAADQMLSFMEKNIDAMVNAKGMVEMHDLMGSSGMTLPPGLRPDGSAGVGSGVQGMHSGTGTGAGSCHGATGSQQQSSGIQRLLPFAPRWLMRG